MGNFVISFDKQVVWCHINTPHTCLYSRNNSFQPSSSSASPLLLLIHYTHENSLFVHPVSASHGGATRHQPLLDWPQHPQSCHSIHPTETYNTVPVPIFMVFISTSSQEIKNSRGRYEFPSFRSSNAGRAKPSTQLSSFFIVITGLGSHKKFCNQ